MSNNNLVKKKQNQKTKRKKSPPPPRTPNDCFFFFKKICIRTELAYKANNYINNTFAFFECKLTFDNLVIQVHVIHKHALALEFNVTCRINTRTNTTIFPVICKI